MALDKEKYIADKVADGYTEAEAEAMASHLSKVHTIADKNLHHLLSERSPKRPEVVEQLKTETAAYEEVRNKANQRRNT